MRKSIRDYFIMLAVLLSLLIILAIMLYQIYWDTNNVTTSNKPPYTVAETVRKPFNQYYK